MLHTEQNKFVVAIRVFRISHHATCFWQIDDETANKGDMHVSLTGWGTEPDTIVIG
jgi:hypothetical protein